MFTARSREAIDKRLQQFLSGEVAFDNLAAQVVELVSPMPVEEQDEAFNYFWAGVSVIALTRSPDFDMPLVAGALRVTGSISPASQAIAMCAITVIQRVVAEDSESFTQCDAGGLVKMAQMLESNFSYQAG